MQARQYRPDIGRFLTQDRFESASGDVRLQSDPLTQNRYAFAGGNPVSRVEWDGHRVINNPYCAATAPVPHGIVRRGGALVSLHAQFRLRCVGTITKKLQTRLIVTTCIQDISGQRRRIQADNLNCDRDGRAFTRASQSFGVTARCRRGTRRYRTSVKVQLQRGANGRTVRASSNSNIISCP